MGAGGFAGICVDSLLLLHMEGRQVDRQGSLLYISVPVHPTRHPAREGSHFGRSLGRHQVLVHT